MGIFDKVKEAFGEGVNTSLNLSGLGVISNRFMKQPEYSKKTKQYVSTKTGIDENTLNNPINSASNWFKKNKLIVYGVIALIVILIIGYILRPYASLFGDN